METVVEDVIQSDFRYMNTNYDEFVMYESTITLNEYLDEDCTGTVAQIVNVFQTLDEDNPRVVMITHNDELMVVKEVQGQWLEDVVLDPSELNLTYRQAYERLMATDCIKPHSKYCVLRRPLGPVICNSQYIFGNQNSSLQFVDAVTGNVTDKDPAFNQLE